MKYLKEYNMVNESKSVYIPPSKTFDHITVYFFKYFDYIVNKFEWVSEYYSEYHIYFKPTFYLKNIYQSGDLYPIKMNHFFVEKYNNKEECIQKFREELYRYNRAYWDFNDIESLFVKMEIEAYIGTNRRNESKSIKVKEGGKSFMKGMFESAEWIVDNNYKIDKSVLDKLSELDKDKYLYEMDITIPNFLLTYKFDLDVTEFSANIMKKLNT